MATRSTVLLFKVMYSTSTAGARTSPGTQEVLQNHTTCRRRPPETRCRGRYFSRFRDESRLCRDERSPAGASPDTEFSMSFALA